jgi:hypothetical protein
MSDGTLHRMHDLAAELLKLAGIRQGHIEIHAYDGEPTHIDRVDKSIKFKPEKRHPK